ncbi:MAG TPA: hypothetical protein VMF89_19975, partial [Polyangiales bacterium]|nr:hypothetical protein [Polyangiales bacterium]
SVLCPGAIRTPILQGGKYGRMRLNTAARAEVAKLWETLRPMPVDELAPKVIAAVARNEAFIIYPSWWRVLWYLERVSPALTSKLCELAYARLREQALTERHANPEVPASPTEADRKAADM